MTAHLQNEGRPIFIRGYSVPFDSPSIPLDEYGGKRELIRPNAFDHVLRNLRASMTCTLHHMNASGTIGSIFDGTLQLWTDDFGLAFQCGPLAINSKNVWAVKSIVSGGIRGCSWRGIPAEMATEKIDGETVVIIEKIQHLAHVGPIADPVYPSTAVWCSHEHPDDLPDHIKPLVRHFDAHRPVARPSPPARSEAPRPQVPPRVEQAMKAYHEANARRPLHTRTRRRTAA